MYNPINVELVKQLSDALDDPKIKEDKLNLEVSNNLTDSDQETQKHSRLDVNERQSSVSRHPATLHFEPSDGFNESDVDEDVSPDEPSLDMEPSDRDILEPDIPDMSSDIDDTDLVESGIEIQTELSGKDIQELLMSSESLKSITRVSIKNDEVWCYFDDSTNLNKILNDVLDVIENDDRYSSLSFSRLARSDNAVVLDM